MIFSVKQYKIYTLINWLIKDIFMYILLTVIIIFLYSSEVYANGIVIDGNYDDWIDMPNQNDPLGDIGESANDFKIIKYFADSNYLYLYLERRSANLPSEFDMILKNSDNNLEIYHITIVKAKHGNFVDITIENGNSIIDTFYIRRDNHGVVELGISLEYAGLEGQNNLIEFYLQSIPDRNGNIDRLPDNGIIIITTGSSFWQLTTIIAFIITLVIIRKHYKKRDIKN